MDPVTPRQPTRWKKTKAAMKRNRDKALVVAAGAGALGTAYFYGKTKGEQRFELKLDFYPATDAEEPTHQENLIGELD